MTTTLRPLAGLAAVVLGSSLALTGCGDDDQVVQGPTPTVTVTATPTPGEPGTGTPPTGSPTAPSSSAPSSTTAGRPAPDQCLRLDEAPDGRYTVADAGSAVVTRDGNRLSVGQVSPAAGWQARIDKDDPDEVEIEFRNGTDQLDLEVEIDDGVFEAQVCNDDD